MSPVGPLSYSRTRVLGFSVPNGEWADFYATIANPSAWELLWYSGGAVDCWADPNSDAWLGSHGASGALLNGVGGATDPTVSPGSVDRVVLVVSGLSIGPTDPVTGGTRPDLSITGSTTGFPPGGYSIDVPTWRAYIAAAIANVRSKYPNVKMILLQPNLGGPSGGGQCLAASTIDGDPSSFSVPSGIVRCCFTNPYIVTACCSLVRANVRMGLIDYVSACSGIRDWAGHLVSSEYTARGIAWANYYNLHF